MINRRSFLLSAAAATVPLPALASTQKKSARLPRKFRPQVVSVSDGINPGEIHVVLEDHFLYWTLGGGKAMRYGIAAGAEGRNFRGTAHIRRKAEWPRWVPTANMIRKEPHIYGKFPSGLPGGHERNPLGARAMYMYRRI